ncbi:MAG: F420-dependent methylenetetrahydromethanopterin dehydrogenase [Candidatus Lokiarchaeota archaeon]|nr:F420-dependent methylenetetrahydromethanopterin dehydrogenase [Candidatus Lokiarchaeota archaeon]MBD3340585.1 F420-dependent methylenetetrahydromethanopterin dehydrogenase [Candidatus Lokiarchaeota archaeon]
MSESKVLKIGVHKNGTIGSSVLLSFLIDERAEAERLVFREVTSGPKMHPPEECVTTMNKLLEFEPELILMSSPNAALKGPKAARELVGNTPTIVISDAPAKKAIEEFKEKNMGYIIVGCDSMIGARRPFLDPIEMSIFNADLLKVLAITGAFNIIVNELNKVIMDMLEGKTPTLPQIEINAENATQAAGFSNPYARAKAIAAFELASQVSKITGRACFVLKEREKYMPLLAASHEMMRTASLMCDKAREIEKSNDTVLRTPHHAKQHILSKRALHEKEK